MRPWVYFLAVSALVLPSIGLAAPTQLNARFALHRKAPFVPTSSIPVRCDDLSTPAMEPNYSPNWDFIHCATYVVTGPAPGGSEVYLVVGMGDPAAGIASARFGIDYDGRDPDGQPETGDEFGIMPAYVSWWTCADGLLLPADGPLGDWPAPQSGATVTWVGCTNEEVMGSLHAVVGSIYLYAYSEDVLRITPNNQLQSGPELSVQDCLGNVTDFLGEFPPGLHASLTGKIHLGGDGSEGYSPCGDLPVRSITWGELKARFAP